MAGTAITDTKAAITALSAADQQTALATGVNANDQLNAIISNLEGAALMVQNLNSLGLTSITTALNTVATDLT